MKYNFTDKELAQLASRSCTIFSNVVKAAYNFTDENYDYDDMHKVFLSADKKEIKFLRDRVKGAEYGVNARREEYYATGKNIDDAYKEQYGFAVTYFKSLCNKYITNTNNIKKEN